MPLARGVRSRFRGGREGGLAGRRRQALAGLKNVAGELAGVAAADGGDASAAGVVPDDADGVAAVAGHVVHPLAFAGVADAPAAVGLPVVGRGLGGLDRGDGDPRAEQAVLDVDVALGDGDAEDGEQQPDDQQRRQADRQRPPLGAGDRGAEDGDEGQGEQAVELP
ncbi:MAG TPA: hypothetical protein VD766_13475, partial [Solirubrobacterales bacterium]|nr:hypothetical protein [Solirubrobacterales bacterium]